MLGANYAPFEGSLRVASGWLRGAYRLATSWPEGGLRVASGAAWDAIPPVPPKTTKNHRKGCKPLAYKDLGNSSQPANNLETIAVQRSQTGCALRFSAFLCVSALKPAWSRAKKTSLAPPGEYARLTRCAVGDPK